MDNPEKSEIEISEESSQSSSQEALFKAAYQRRKEAAEQRLLLAREMQMAGLLIMQKANIPNLKSKDAIQLLGASQKFLTEGMRAERLELGEPSLNLYPQKPLKEMSDSELEEYINRFLF